MAPEGSGSGRGKGGKGVTFGKGSKGAKASKGGKRIKQKTSQDALKGIRPIVIGLILSVAIGILYKNLFLVSLNFSNLNFDFFDYKAFIIIVIAFILCFGKFKIKGKVLKINPIILILICGIMGLILYTIL